jgi:hypothetical protein
MQPPQLSVYVVINEHHNILSISMKYKHLHLPLVHEKCYLHYSQKLEPNSLAIFH